ncbi:MAG TPA: biotin/lipoyl-containing protein [Terriglobia bacterium]|nr:biotin/lipoyl-containing protein [Terriglobia bacterium]
MHYTLIANGREHVLEVAGRGPLACRLDGESFEAEAVEVAAGVYSLLMGGKSYRAYVARPIGRENPPGRAAETFTVQVDGVSYSITVQDPRRWSGGRGMATREGRQQVTAPMPGKVIRVLAQEGEAVGSGQGLVVVEAMKMQNEIKSRAAGTVRKVLVREGQAVAGGEILMLIE